MFLCFKKSIEWQEMPDRTILTNKPDLLLIDNHIETSKYNLITFLPKNIFEQFSKLANLYFLIIGVLEMIPEISTSDGQPVIWLPLLVIMMITAIKDLCEDFQRHRSDRKENEKIAHVLSNNGFIDIKWQHLRVGNVIKVKLFYLFRFILNSFWKMNIYLQILLF